MALIFTLEIVSSMEGIVDHVRVDLRRFWGGGKDKVRLRRDRKVIAQYLFNNHLFLSFFLFLFFNDIHI